MSKSKKFTEQREAVLAEIEKIAATAETEERELTVEEESTRDELAAQAGKLSARAITAKATEKDEKVAKAAESRNATGQGEQSANDAGGNVHVRSSEHLYRKNGEHDYFADVMKASQGNYGAAERLRRHAQETSVDAVAAEARMKAGSARAMDRYFVGQTRTAMGHVGGATEIQARTGDLSTAATAGGEFVPPAYLTEQFVPLARAGRVIADSVTHMDLPEGTMVLNIPKVTGGTSVATQGGTENTTVSDTAAVTAFDTFNVVTFAGQQIVSQQIIDRSPINFTEMIFGDLLADQARYVDTQVISGSGSSGQVLGLTNTPSPNTQTWTQASPTFGGFYGQVASLKSKIADTRFLPATHIFMTPTRWEWLESSVDANGRPLVVPEANGVYNAAQVGPDSAVAEGAVGGRFLGLDVAVDFNIPANLGGGTNQDIVIVVRASDSWLYESPIITRALPQTYGNQLSTLIQLYSYGAFTSNRYPKSVGILSGTGLVAPTFPS